MILALKGQKELLEGNPVLQRTIRLRNPHVDPMKVDSAIKDPETVS